MEPGKRSKNFTEREKMLLFEVAKEFVHIIDSKRTDGTSVEAKKRAWMVLSNKYNAVSETGFRTEKQLHALYDNIKKKARKNMSDDKSKMYKTGDGTFCPKTSDDNFVAKVTPQFKPLTNEFDSSAPYNLDMETRVLNGDAYSGTSQKNIINNLSTSIINLKNQKLMNEDAITNKKIEILELQQQQQVIKLQKTIVLLDLDIELKKLLQENAKMDLEYKKKNLNL